MGIIKVMSEHLANQIAAGEVVEKTLNVVKELVENSIDAKSTEIKIELIDSGVKEIKITDNGIGMDKEDALTAFSRHATSKLIDEDDLFNINSLGFRGEALPSIASVSHIIMNTSKNEVGTYVEIDGGTLKSISSAPFRQGTIITVKDLFYNTPVRLKYLKNLYIELANITDYINKIALSYPDIKFTLINNDKKLLATDGKGRLLKVISDIYGIEVAKKMIEINSSNDDYEINGYISYPEIVRANKNVITTLVNGRVIKNNEINRMILDSYHTYIAVDKFPIVVLNIEVDPILVDVNIHPTKTDIKFSKIEPLKAIIKETIEEKLKKLTLIPTIENISEEEKTVLENNLFKEVNYTISDSEENVSYENINIEFDTEISYTDNTIEKTFEKEERIKKLYPVGLVHGTYIIAENELGMFIIDQHAANERINYELFLEKMSNKEKEVMDLLIPITIELTNSDFIILKENFNILEDLGINYELFGINTILIRSVPNWLPKNNLEEAINKIIYIIISKEDFSIEKFIEKVAITLACKMSIKANDHITHSDMEYLLDKLRSCNNPFTCPHGRPTIITYSKYELEKLFKRAE
ncbi:MAG: DNA mismatch repair endonuclease MutL [Bacilli bacterium]|nr:DNA mismatch repair endonuclease MutL [Bacilli bacterium]